MLDGRVASGLWARLMTAAAIACVVASPVFAAPPASPVLPVSSDPGPVPLRQNFSAAETAAAVAAATGGVYLLLLGDTIMDAPAPSMGVPDQGSVDSRLSRWLYNADGKGERLWWRIPDRAGFVLPALPLMLYGSSALSFAYRGQPLWPGRDGNAQHRLVAYTEAVGWTYLVTGLVKYMVGRPRPYTEEANNHPELRGRASEDNLSFFSGHASGTFAAGAFLAEDVSRFLNHQVLADRPRALRFFAGTLAPFTLGYGVPMLISISRIVDQQHWPSDVLLGAVVGTLIAHLTYASHFDADGRPRRRWPSAGQVVPVVAERPGGGAQLTMAFVGRF